MTCYDVANVILLALPFGRKFSFEPSAGVLSVGQTQLVTITLSSDVLGEFSESFEWQIVGGSSTLALDFRGRVVGPTFTIDVDELDFGIVSYGYRQGALQDPYTSPPFFS